MKKCDKSHSCNNENLKFLLTLKAISYNILYLVLYVREIKQIFHLIIIDLLQNKDIVIIEIKVDLPSIFNNSELK